MAATGLQVRSGVKWVAIAQISQRGVRLMSTMVLARLLVPVGWNDLKVQPIP